MKESQQAAVDVKIETYVKVIMSLGVDEARALYAALAHTDSTTDDIFSALGKALDQVDSKAAA
jgi:hypothetical protein